MHRNREGPLDDYRHVDATPPPPPSPSSAPAPGPTLEPVTLAWLLGGSALSILLGFLLLGGAAELGVVLLGVGGLALLASLTAGAIFGRTLDDGVRVGLAIAAGVVAIMEAYFVFFLSRVASSAATCGLAIAIPAMVGLAVTLVGKGILLERWGGAPQAA